MPREKFPQPRRIVFCFGESQHQENTQEYSFHSTKKRFRVLDDFSNIYVEDNTPKRANSVLENSPCARGRIVSTIELTRLNYRASIHKFRYLTREIRPCIRLILLRCSSNSLVEIARVFEVHLL